MKRTSIYIRLRVIYILYLLMLCPFFIFSAQSQGYNNNEWIFGYCGRNAENNYISFGKGSTPNVNTLPGSVVIGQNNNAIAIDPITGEPLFYTNGELVYNYLDDPIQGAPNGINGDFEGTQTVAIAALNYEQNGERTFYTFYISPAGELQYSVIDMNAQGDAPANSPPAGEVTSLNQPISSASGAISVIKTPDSPSYLISYEGGQLVSREITDQEGVFTEMDFLSLPNAPDRMIFNEETSQLILLPEDSSSPITVLDFDTLSGTFSSPRELTFSTSIPSVNYGGAEYSPDGNFIYFTRGDELLRVPTDDLEAEPEIIPSPNPSGNVNSQLLDIKVGPDGQLYYIYQEEGNDAFYVGTLENPDNPLLEELEVDADPFEGTDFCGGQFPLFAPNEDIDVTVDFTYEPQDPCMNNALQLTSFLDPANIPIRSYEWELTPPPTDEDGSEIELELNEEHLLLPANATNQESVTVTLTVELADGSRQTVNHTISFTENNLQASFTPSDTTTCKTCLDLNEMLEVSSGEEGQGGSGGGSGGGIGGIPGTGGGSGQDGETAYEYFWSNKKEEGWIGEGPNEVCKPGTYWVLAREEGSTCYVYAETTVKMWDPVANEKVDDQTNNIWYFGENAGLDFNPDPDNPDGPLPRPVEDPGFDWDIPAGTTTISDQTGQVLFYTDGQSVWDLNGNLMEGGEDIGGDNTSTQSVIAIKVPQEQTLYYLFTTQSNSSGTNTVKFSLVDIKGENTTGVGSVVSPDNFLFNPGTEQSAAIESGDTTWVMFHELGNNTFRAYPVTSQGIGQAVPSSVGTNHGYGAGVGSMKFSPDGEQVAVTIYDENGCSTVDIFDFDESTGELKEYATIDLGCSDEVYGLEFSSDSNKIFVSYRDGKGIEEIAIKGLEIDDEEGGSEICPTCFADAESRDQIEACIEASRNLLSGSAGGDLGAIQMGPNGVIYVSVVGAPQVGQINPGSDCNPSSYTSQGPATNGSNNLGLPSYVQNSGSNIPEPELSGPDRLCLDQGLALAEFQGAGEPDIDFYNWAILDIDGGEVFSYSGTGDDFQFLEYEFDSAGIFTVTLNVERCGNPDYYNGQLDVEVVGPPPLTLEDDITLCSGSPITLTAIEGYDPAEGLYDFEWTNAAGDVFGDNNSNSIEVTEESIYTVVVSFRPPADADESFQACSAMTSVFVGPAFEFELTQEAEESCYEENYITFAPDTPISGQWFYQLQGSTEAPVLLGVGYEWEVNPEELPSPGVYDIIFAAEDPILEGCVVEERASLTINPLPEFTIDLITGQSTCENPTGSFAITMLEDANSVSIIENGEEFLNVANGDVLGPFENLPPGNYTVVADRGGCEFVEVVTIANATPPGDFSYEVIASPETCGPDGILPGSIVINMTGLATEAGFIITNEDNGDQIAGSITNSTVTVELGKGSYAVEVSEPSGCIFPDTQRYLIIGKSLVNFSAPSQVQACEIFYFAPDPPLGVNYTITFEDGSIYTPQPNGIYTLDQEGIYTIRGEDPSGENCPRIREMEVVLNNQVRYDIEELYDCDTGLRYLAVLDDEFDPSNYNFFWRNVVGVIVGREQSFVPNNPGDFSLDVQPKQGAACPAAWLDFYAPEVPARVPVEIIIESGLCTNTSTGILRASYDAPATANLEPAWYRVTADGQSIRIPEFDGLDEIAINEEGTYRVRLINSVFGQTCSVGTDKATLVDSDAVAPELEDSYTICAVEGITETLQPTGEWRRYQWYLEDELISSNAAFTPTLPGDYTLIVTDIAGCTFMETFTVIEDCGLKITTPNALIPTDPERNFVVYVNDYVDEISVLIYNRWGELIFHCIQENVPENSPFCTWDGTVGGKKVPIGTYPVVIKFKSRDQNLEQIVKKAIVVIE